MAPATDETKEVCCWESQFFQTWGLNAFVSTGYIGCWLGLSKALPGGWHSPQITALLLSSQGPLNSHQEEKRTLIPVPTLLKLTLPTPLSPVPTILLVIHFWLNHGLLNLLVCDSQSAKHRCSVFLDYFNQYLLGCSASGKGSLHNHECLICAYSFSEM